MNKQNMETQFDGSRIGFSVRLPADQLINGALDSVLPKLELLGGAWTLLKAPEGRAIPEEIVNGLSAKGIQPIIHVPVEIDAKIRPDEFLYELKAYANWGVKYVSFFDRPNLRGAWPKAGWTQMGLVNRFMDAFLPLAHAAIEAGLSPILPAFEPGGDYWDTAFLRRFLERLVEAEEEEILAKLVIGARVSGGHGIDWGAGGPEVWPEAVPYYTPENSEDHRGFRIFDWYNAIMRATVERELPILLFASGSASDTLTMARRIAIGLDEGISKLLTVPENVIGLIFDEIKTESDEWFGDDHTPSTHGEEWIMWKTGRKAVELAKSAPANESRRGRTAKNKDKEAHYVLLPTYSWGKSKFHLEAIKPFAKKHGPKIGYSLSQARKAARVTIIGGSHIFKTEIIEMLQNSGCEVNHIVGDGQHISEQLAQL